MRMQIDGVIGEFTSLPGCSQIVVSHGVYVPIVNRGKGAGTSANKKRLALAKELGYDMIVCTVSDENEGQKHVLETNGWECLKTFLSSKTNHNVHLYGKVL